MSNYHDYYATPEERSRAELSSAQVATIATKVNLAMRFSARICLGDGCDEGQPCPRHDRVIECVGRYQRLLPRWRAMGPVRNALAMACVAPATRDAWHAVRQDQGAIGADCRGGVLVTGKGVLAHVKPAHPDGCGYCCHPTMDGDDDGNMVCGICGHVEPREQGPAMRLTPLGQQRLLCIVARIYQRPETWEQLVYHCGSAHCVAGHAELDARDVGQLQPWGTWNVASDWLELTTAAGYLFDPDRTLPELINVAITGEIPC